MNKSANTFNTLDLSDSSFIWSYTGIGQCTIFSRKDIYNMKPFLTVSLNSDIYTDRAATASILNSFCDVLQRKNLKEDLDPRLESLDDPIGD